MAPFTVASNPRKGTLGLPVVSIRRRKKHFLCFVCRSIGDRFTVGIMVTGGQPHHFELEDTALVDEVGK